MCNRPQRSEQPRAAAFLNLTLETKTQLRERYKGVPIYSSCEEMIADKEVMEKLDGVTICTAHACHADMGKSSGCRKVRTATFRMQYHCHPPRQIMSSLCPHRHVLMEKPMTVDVPEARDLAAAADKALAEQKGSG